MNKENKRKSLFFTLFATFLMLIISFVCFVPTTIVVYASAEEDISIQSDVSTDDVRTRYKTYTPDYVTSNICLDTQYYDSSVVNDTNNGILKDSVYAWSNGANVMNNNINEMVFTLNLRNPSFYLNSQFCTYYFTIYKASKDTSTSEKLFAMRFVGCYKSGTTDPIWALGVKQFAFSDETFSLVGIDKNVNSQADRDIYYSYSSNEWIINSIEESGYTLVNVNAGADLTDNSLPFYGDIEKNIHLVMETSNTTDEYFVELGWNYTDKDNKTFDNGVPITTRCVSVYDIVKQMNDRHELSYLTEDMQNQAQLLINDGTTRKVQVSWLERIGETPFATRKYDYVEVPIVNNMISPSDVATALGIETFAVGQSSCQYFKEDKATGVFNAYYLKNVWLSSKDANGHSMNLFLDINTSYKDYYYPFVRDGIFTTGMYEWFWSTMIVKYPEISGIDDANLYGYFGYTSVPFTYTLNQLVYEMFDGSPNMDGVVRYFSYRDNLSHDSYMKLLSDYDYGWMAKAWNTVAGFVAGQEYPADHYFFYCDGEEDNAFIGNNGADNAYDNGWAVSNKIQDICADIGEGLGIIFENPLTKWLALGLGLVFGTWFIMFLFCSFFKVKKARQEYKNAKSRRRKR